MEIAVITHEGKEAGHKVVLPQEIYNVIPQEHAVWLDVRRLLNAQRQGTHKTKERSEIQATTKKAFKQKGTGRARRGSAKSNILRGGGRTFGPKPRDYAFKLNKKQKKKARRIALSEKARAKKIIVLAPFSLEGTSTKAYLSILKSLNLADKKTLLVLPSVDKAVVESARNLSQARVMLANQLNTFEILKANHLIISEESLPIIETICLCQRS